MNFGSKGCTRHKFLIECNIYDVVSSFEWNKAYNESS